MFGRWSFYLNRWRYKKRYARRRRGTRRWIWYGMFTACAGALVLSVYVVYLDFVIRTQFEGKRWALPARVYARPLELFPGRRLTADQFQGELTMLGYHKARRARRPGNYARRGSVFHVITRPFTFWDGEEPSLSIRLKFNKSGVASLRQTGDGHSLGLVRLEPALIGSIYPAHNEDRILLKLSDTPPLLIKALLAVEDKDFFNHHGIKPRSIVRALFANLRARSTVQGGSTLTQQLVKNFFLSHERTLWRKFNEAIMALLVEWRYEKDEILEAYLNEIFLGQDGKRSIHGFGLASRFYFERPINELRTDQLALLAALVKGASYYDPRRNRLRALQRRNLVLDQLVDLGSLNSGEAGLAKAQKLDVTAIAKSGVTQFPSFMDLVRRQLRRDYREKDLTSEGLQIFTTLDPLIQYDAEKALSQRILKLEKNKNLPAGDLQGALIVVGTDNAEVLAMVGDRNPRYAGFNRVLDAVRQIGSLIKPAVYLTALEQPEKYTLITILQDTPLVILGDNGKPWKPQNFDHKFHGDVPLHTSLAKSYNTSTARLGIELGVTEVVKTLRRLGVQRKTNTYPSMFLGAIALSPLEVAQMYHTIANGGFRAPLRAIRAVLTVEGHPLQRYPLSIFQAFDSGSMYLLNNVLQEAVREGTGRALYHLLPQSLNLAGKTGTTDELRDSWFAGFTADRLAVVWLGMDDNRPAKLTGSSGAMRVWGDLFKVIGAKPNSMLQPANIDLVWIDPETNLRAGTTCHGAIQVPFIRDSAPLEYSPCMGSLGGTLEKMINRFTGNSR